MKKIVVGVVLTAFLVFSGQAYSANSSLIGEKVDSEMAVSIDGSDVGTAIVVNGRSYLPVRDMANALDLGLEVEKGSVNLVQSQGIIGSEKENMLEYLSTNKSQIEKQIVHYNEAILHIQNVMLPKWQKEYNAENNEFVKSKLQGTIDDCNEAIADHRSKISDYQTQLDVINQQISDLEAQ